MKTILLPLFLILITISLKAQELQLTLVPSFYINCFGEQTGSIDLTVTNGTPPYEYRWSTEETTEDISNLAAGYYSVYVTDQNGKEGRGETTLKEPERMSVRLIPFVYPNDYNISCYGCYNGSITVEVIGGKPPYTFTWRDKPNIIVQNPTSLGTGTYAVIVTDDNQCEAYSDEVFLREPERAVWDMSGNYDSNPSIHYIGTSDNTDFVLRTNAQEALRITSDGDLKVAGLAGNGSQLIKVDNEGIISAAPSSNDPWMTEGNNLNGNAQTNNTATEWIGTTTQDDFVIKTNQDGNDPLDPSFIDNERMRVTSGGLVGIETKDPKSKLHLNSTEEYSYNDTYRFYEIPLEWDDNGEEIPISLPENATSIGITTFQITNNNTGIAETDGLIMAVDGTGAVVKNRDGGLQLNASGPVSLNAGNGGSLSLFSSTVQLYSPGRIQMLATNYVRLSTVNSLNAFYIHSDGRVGIGTNEIANGYKLSVYGKIMSEELMVQLKPNWPWPDYVFKKEYKLTKLNELEKYVMKNNHLPGIPSASEIEDKGGFEVGEMQRLQMEKIEELYLYVIELNKEVEILKEQNKKLNARIKNK